jgi:hypothetical protein
LTDLAEDEYQGNGWKGDSLLACLREFSEFPLFRNAADGESHELFERSYVFDIHQLPEDLRKLAAFLTLDRLYSEIMSLPDAPIALADSHRRSPSLFVMPAAHT